MSAEIRLYDTRRREKRALEPADPRNVRMYVCGPTVYDLAHIGNARPFLVFDVLFRLLRHVYGAQHVTYVRNITDVEDKINARAAELGISIETLTERTIAQFHQDVDALGVLRPTHEPRATGYVEEMREIIERLIAKGHAYVAQDHVLFAVGSLPQYGTLSRRSLDEMIAGARVDVAPYKRDGLDFVLWKPSTEGQPAWPSPGGIATPGRPGWHIECSAMAQSLLGTTFDIHGGGIDLVFPHHENERAQTVAAFGVEEMAGIWMHNGFLQVEGRKMSKSEGNFLTIRDALQSAPGPSLRLAMLMTHYRQPIDWTAQRLSEAGATLKGWAANVAPQPAEAEPDAGVLEALCEDLNTPRAIARLSELSKDGDPALGASAAMLGLDLAAIGRAEAEARGSADPAFVAKVERLIAERLAARRDKRFEEADRLRADLTAMGVALKDGKGADGAPVTTWELA